MRGTELAPSRGGCYVRPLGYIPVHCSADHYSIIYVNRHPFWLVSKRNGLDAHILTFFTGIFPFDMNLPIGINPIRFLPHPRPCSAGI